MSLGRKTKEGKCRPNKEGAIRQDEPSSPMDDTMAGTMNKGSRDKHFSLLQGWGNEGLR